MQAAKIAKTVGASRTLGDSNLQENRSQLLAEVNRSITVVKEEGRVIIKQ